MSTANAGLAEVYVMKKLHKEKMKKMEASNKLKSAEGKVDHRYNKEGKKSGSATASEGGCFSLLKLRKIHANSALPASADS